MKNPIIYFLGVICMLAGFILMFGLPWGIKFIGFFILAYGWDLIGKDEGQTDND